MFRKAFFQAHWLVGVTVGTILAFSGLTGGLMAFGPELTTWFSGGYHSVAAPAPDAQPLSAQALYQAVHDAVPDRPITEVMTFADPHRPARVTFASQATYIGPTAPIAETRVIDPYTGQLLPARPAGHAVARFMSWLRDVHQGHWGAPGATAPNVGGFVIGLGSVLLFFMALTGLYLRWPRGRAARNWRSWLKIYPRLKGRAFLFNLHTVFGTFVLLVYLVIAHSGAFQSQMSWYGNGVRALVGLPALQEGPPGGAPGGGPGAGPGGPGAAPGAGPGGAGGPGAGPGGPGGPGDPNAGRLAGPVNAVNLVYMGPGAYIDADNGEINARTSVLDLKTGTITPQAADPPATTFGQKLAANNQIIHEGRIFGRAGTAVVMCAALCMPVFYVTGWMMYLGRRRQKRRRRDIL